MKIITTADIHLRNDDTYGKYNEKGLNDFLLYRYKMMSNIIKKSRQGW